MYPPEKSRPQRISRRSFLTAAAGAAGLLACSGGGSQPGDSGLAAAGGITPTGYGYEQWDRIFRTITAGFIENALHTSDTFAVCYYRGGTRTDNFRSASGHTCDSVTRILPALAARIASPDGEMTVEAAGGTRDLREIFVRALSSATDPEGPDFWQYADPGGWDQRQVESSIVAFSLWLAAPVVMDEFTAAQRRNIQKWLASCTVFSEHTNNWALFTAVNHAARLALSDRWSEFAGDADAFREDIATIGRMYAGDGWYHDSIDGDEYDYYNFWVFASHNLYWDMMVGDRFPGLREEYRERLRLFLSTTPFLFGGNGSHVLWGRSLIYRWATLTPLTLAHGMGLWPGSNGLLRRICNSNLRFLWEAGAWDSDNAKLRETLAPGSSPEIKESYINNGHPYWGMQAFHAASFGTEDPFWSAPEEPLPVEQGDFEKVIESPGLLLRGEKRTGQVQVWQSRCTAHYGNKYYNFSYSSHFSWNVGTVEGLTAPDCSLSFTDSRGNYGRRNSPYRGRIISSDSLAWPWETMVGETRVEVESFCLIEGELQWRAHRVRFGGGRELTAMESTCALGLEAGETPQVSGDRTWQYGRSYSGGEAVYLRAIFGFNGSRELSGFRGRDDLNSLRPRGLQAGVTAKLRPGEHLLVAAVYASPDPLPLEELGRMTDTMPSRLAEWAGMEV